MISANDAMSITKSYHVERAASLIPAIEQAIEEAAKQGKTKITTVTDLPQIKELAAWSDESDPDFLLTKRELIKILETAGYRVSGTPNFKTNKLPTTSTPPGVSMFYTMEISWVK